MRTQVTPLERDGCQVWVAPIHDWDKSDCNAFIEQERLQRNQVVDLLHRAKRVMTTREQREHGDRPILLYSLVY
jgi:predicted phosphoadenosine phosphosulfate sulfurtransferase